MKISENMTTQVKHHLVSALFYRLSLGTYVTICPHKDLFVEWASVFSGFCLV